jgi:hypothetical protein
MRAQNFDLTILDAVENPKEAKHNAIVFEGEKAILQYSKFKTVSTYGFTKFYLSDFLAKYLKLFVTHVRPWFFPSRTDAPLNGSLLFINQSGTAVKQIGTYFMDTTEIYFNKRIEISTVRKIMETAVSECTALDMATKDELSKSMLHDPDTAQRYYVHKAASSESQSINKQWDVLYNHYLQSTATLGDNTNMALIKPPAVLADVLLPTASPPLKRILTSSLFTAVPVEVEVPSLVSSPHAHSSKESALSIAHTVAKDIVATPQKQVYPLKPGDWMCSFCGYTNFAYRQLCNCCGKDYLKRPINTAQEQTKRSKLISGHDITAVLSHSTDKHGKNIYRVKSKVKGEIWVNQKHVPAHLLDF